MIPSAAAEKNLNVADSLKTATSTIIEQVKADPDTFLQKLGEQALHFGLKVLAALAIYFVGAWLIKKVRHILVTLFARKNTEGTLATFITSLVNITLYILLVIITVSTLGINTTSLAALLAAGGMAVGMALSGTVQNFAGGIMLLIFKPFKSGDYIEAQGYFGRVDDVSITSTKITTLDNRVVILPNGALSNGNINNWSEKPLRRVEWEISVAYDSDADKFIEAAKDILASDTRILDSTTEGAKDVYITLNSLNANDITFKIRAWVRTADYWHVYFDGNKALFTELPKRGFSFAYPHVDVNVLNH